MGIFGALTTAVTGLRAQSFALENISGNIANSQTTAFKRQDTSFEDLIPDNAVNVQLAGNVVAYSRSTNSVQGDIQNAQVGTFMAINGRGFFVVEKPSTFASGQPVFDGGDLYTRRGDFSTDKNGYLVNGAGYYLMGIPVDPTSGNLVGSVPSVLKFDSGFLPAQPTTQIEYKANLAAYPLTLAHDTTVPKSELLDPTTGYHADPTVAGAGVVQAQDEPLCLQNSISGGTITAYDISGTPVNVQLRWAKTDSSLYGGTDTWNLFYQSDSTATGTATAWTNAGTDYKFGAGGQLTPAIPAVTLSSVTIDSVPLGTVTLDHGASGLTQFADANGNAQVNTLQQNGFPAGTLQSVSVSDKGHVVGNYSNGRTIDLAQITLANFNDEDSLKRIDGGAFVATDESGPPTYNASGRIVGSSLEGSNTDIADEFTKLIVTQQAYSANTRVITTSNQMVQDLLNMLR
jgi:flagellar hook protein FlgE